MTSFGEVYGTTVWDCASSTNTGTFTRSTVCTISGNNHVAVSNTLEINGTNTDMNHLITITAATNKRHFYLNHANAKLILRYLKLVGGDVSSYSDKPDYYGGAVCIYTNGGELNLYSSIVFENKAYRGGGISAYAASSKNAIMNVYNSVINNNEVSSHGGGIYTSYAVGTVYNTTIDNNQASSGGGMYTDKSDVTMKMTIISNNNAEIGGGLWIQYSGTVILRQSSFINNDATNNGDEIYVLVGTSPTISLINTYFSNPNNNNNIYELYGAPTWKTCSDNLCTESPFTGTCNAVNNANSKLGVLCNLNCSTNQFAPLVSVAISAPSSSDTCKPWQTCDAGYKRVNGNATSDATCVQCDQGQFQSANQFNGTTCQVWQDAKCNAGYKRVNGNATSDATCVQCDQGQFQSANQFNGTTCQVWQDAKCNAGYKRVNGNATSDATCVQCDQGQFQSANQFNGTTCQVWQDAKCNAGYKRVNGNATSDANCVQCGQGQFQSTNQFTGISCTNWKQCNNNEYISFNGNRTTNRICLLKATTTTDAPTTTTNAPPVTTTTNAPTTTTDAPSATTTTNAATTTTASVSTATTSAASVSIANTTSIAPTTTTASVSTATTSAASVPIATRSIRLYITKKRSV
eukprot:g2713.t1